MSYRKYDIWSKELADGRLVEFTYGTLFQAGGRTKSWAGAKISGVALDPILNVAKHFVLKIGKKFRSFEAETRDVIRKRRPAGRRRLCMSSHPAA